MKFAVINGSPKGENGITLQYINYLGKRNPAHEFKVINAAQRIFELETVPGALDRTIDEIAACDAVVWCTPVYYMLVPAQLKRFIELLDGRTSALKGKRAFALVTSVHFYDHLAAEYLRQVSLDMGLDFYAVHSPEMQDLLKEEGRAAVERFFRDFLWFTEKGLPAVLPKPAALPKSALCARFGEAVSPEKSGRKAVVLVFGGSENARAMAETYAKVSPAACEIIDMVDVGITGGCLGCMHCGWDNKCVYKDGYAEFYKNTVCAADIVVFALTAKDRFFTADFKRYLDRSFFLGHTPTLERKSLVFLADCDISVMPVAQEFIYSYAETSGARLCGLVDCSADTEMIAAAAAAADYYAIDPLPPSSTYRSEGAAKLFRDMLYNMDFVFHADYKYYSKRGLFHFPAQDWGMRAFSTVAGALLHIPPLRRMFVSGMTVHMADGHRAVVKKAVP